METTQKTRQDTREEPQELEELPSMLDMLTDSARADTASIDRVGGQRSNTSNAAAWTIGGRVD